MADLLTHYRKLLGMAKGWAGKSLPGWTDDMHRDLLTRHGARQVEGRASSTTMNLEQLSAALADYERRGWPRQRSGHQAAAHGQAPSSTSRKAVPRDIAHIVRLWGGLGTAGLVKQPTRAALLQFCARQISADRVPDLDSLTGPQRQRVIEALKSWGARAA